jgi:probable phosphoglycerate mutase
LFVFARHAESTANAAGVVSANPARHVPLTERGRSQARQLGAQVDCLRIDVAVATRFARTQETAKLALDRRQVPLIIEPALDEIHARAYDGLPLGTYRAWENAHTPSERLPDGESVDDAVLRIATGLRRLLSRTEPVTLVVLHSFALHHIVTAASALHPPGDRALGHAVPYLFHEDGIARAAAGLQAIASDVRGGRANHRDPATTDHLPRGKTRGGLPAPTQSKGNLP